MFSTSLDLRMQNKDDCTMLKLATNIQVDYFISIDVEIKVMLLFVFAEPCLCASFLTARLSCRPPPSSGCISTIPPHAVPCNLSDIDPLAGLATKRLFIMRTFREGKSLN